MELEASTYLISGSTTKPQSSRQYGTGTKIEIQINGTRLCATPEMEAHQAPCPWDSPGKNTGVGCHFLLQCMEVKSESEVTQSCPTLRDPMDCSPQAPPPMGFSRQEYWSGLPLPSPFKVLYCTLKITNVFYLCVGFLCMICLCIFVYHFSIYLSIIIYVFILCII